MDKDGPKPPETVDLERLTQLAGEFCVEAARIMRTGIFNKGYIHFDDGQQSMAGIGGSGAALERDRWWVWAPFLETDKATGKPGWSMTAYHYNTEYEREHDKPAEGGVRIRIEGGTPPVITAYTCEGYDEKTYGPTHSTDTALEGTIPLQDNPELSALVNEALTLVVENIRSAPTPPESWSIQILNVTRAIASRLRNLGRSSSFIVAEEVD